MRSGWWQWEVRIKRIQKYFWCQYRGCVRSLDRSLANGGLICVVILQQRIFSPLLESGRNGSMEREKPMWEWHIDRLPLSTHLDREVGSEPPTHVCALDWESNLWSFGAQGNTLTVEQNLPGCQCAIFVLTSIMAIPFDSVYHCINSITSIACSLCRKMVFMYQDFAYLLYRQCGMFILQSLSMVQKYVEDEET